jgi:phosphohistidine phosphatase
MQLYLVQHGASKSEAEDPQRSLTDHGRHVVELMAQYLTEIEVTIDRIEHSDKLRALQTAEIIAERLRPTEGTKQMRGMGPTDDIQPLRDRLLTESRNVMLVGHLPYLSRLFSTLLEIESDRTVVEFRMGGVVALARSKNGEWRLQWAVTPDLLRGPGTRTASCMTGSNRLLPK